MTTRTDCTGYQDIDPSSTSGEILEEFCHEKFTGTSKCSLQKPSPFDNKDISEETVLQPESLEQRIARLDAERARIVAKRRGEAANPIQRMFATIIPYGGLLASGMSLASSSMGAGIISLPSAFQMSGLVMGIVYMTFVAGLMIYSYSLLGIAAKRTGLRNYEQICFALFGPGADYFLAFIMWVFSFGTDIAYVISLQDALRCFLENSSSVPEYLHTRGGQRVLTAAVWSVLMLPLCLPKEINSLRYFSCTGVLFIVFFVLCMIIHSARNGLRNGPRNDLVYFQTGNNAVNGFTLFVFAFISQLNAYEVLNEMYKPSVTRFTKSAGISVAIVYTMYFLSGVFGYLDFGPAVVGSSLNLYNPIEDPLMGAAYVGIIVKLCVGYGLHMIPIRDAVYHVFKIDVVTIAWWKNAVICGSMATMSLIAGLFIPRINVMFGIVGGLSGGFIGFIFPALMVMYCGNWSYKNVGFFHYVTTYILLFVGVFGVVFGTGTAIYSEIIVNS